MKDLFEEMGSGGTLSRYSTLAEALADLPPDYVRRSVQMLSQVRRLLIRRAATFTAEEAYEKRAMIARSNGRKGNEALTHEQRVERGRKASRMFWDSLTPEQRAIHIEKIRAGNQGGWTEDRRARFNATRAKMTEEEKVAWRKKISEARKAQEAKWKVEGRPPAIEKVRTKKVPEKFLAIEELTPRKIKFVLGALDDGSLTRAEIAREFGLHERTVYRIQKNRRKYEQEAAV